MKALLTHPDRDFDLQQDLPPIEPSMTQDLELEVLLRAMSGEDEFLLGVAHKALSLGLQNDIETILYRQEISKDCMKNPAVVRQLYDLVVEAIESKHKSYWGGLSKHPGPILGSSIDALKMFMAALLKLRGIADEHLGQFDSRGFKTLLAMLQKEFSDDYLASIHRHLDKLRFRAGIVVSAGLGQGNEGVNYVLRMGRDERPSWLEWLIGPRRSAYTFRIDERDEAGAQALSELRDRGIHLVANALAQSVDHILSFFEMLRTELAFHIGCLNLHDRLVTLGAPSCFPVPGAPGARQHRFRGLYDVSLALGTGRSLVGNEVEADGKCLMIITGPNQGGKSRFVRSIGLAQLMMQCGMFVAAEAFSAELCTGLFTHYKREEDATMKSGKFEEEIARMSAIDQAVAPNAMLLFNESFASTNEREGSEIARQIVCALLERRIKVFFVTHQYEFSHAFFVRQAQDVLFLRAERRADGTRSFKLINGEPLATSYGDDLYREIFGARESAQVNAV